ncbi:hypothetical protein KC902_00700 [Candidatus Kaiserbacteria bacterium]|nr:hypothetical protein [Candidatus Kaiserbacteria bacterium]USN88623.1 MAG: hypothetical protein H6780_04010 [Candidatus Nomurabacteria bacterium]
MYTTAQTQSTDVLNMPLEYFLHESFLRKTPIGAELIRKQRFYAVFKEKCQMVAWSLNQPLSRSTINDLLNNAAFYKWLSSDTPVSNHITVLFLTHGVLLS